MTEEVVIVGAGPVGLVAGICLHLLGIKFRIIDKKDRSDIARVNKSKALAVHSRTQELLELLGLSEIFQKKGLQVNETTLYGDDGQVLSKLTIDPKISHFQLLMLSQFKTEEILCDHLESLGHSVEWKREVIDVTQTVESVTIRVADVKLEGEIASNTERNGETIDAKWLLACDGAHSIIRHKMNIPYTGEDLTAIFAMIDCRLGDECIIKFGEVASVFHDKGVVAFFPEPDGYHRLIIDVEVAQKEESLEYFQAILDDRVPNMKAKLSEARWMTHFSPRQRRVEHLRKGRIFFCGDAAHSHSPLGGQGMNTGIQDVFNLCWKLKLHITGIAKTVILDSYNSERISIIQSLLQNTANATKAATVQNSIMKSIRNQTISLATKWEVVRTRIAQSMGMLTLSYNGSPLNFDYDAGNSRFSIKRYVNSDTTPGHRAPDSEELASNEGSKISLYKDIFSIRQFSALFFCGSDHSYVTDEKIVSILAGGYYASLFKVAFVNGFDREKLPEKVENEESQHKSHQEGESKESETKEGDPRKKDFQNIVTIWDKTLELHNRYCGDRPSLYIVRPDSYVAFRSCPPSGDKLLEWLSDKFF